MVDEASQRLENLRDAPPPDDLRRWADAVATGAGVVELFGTGRRAATFPGLLWCGARIARAGLGPVEGLVLVARVSAPRATGTQLERAVAAGVAVGERLDVPPGAGGLTTGVVAAAACAAVAAGADPQRLDGLLDIAASLMVVSPPAAGGDVEHGLWAGHCLAAGWLATRAASAGLVGMPDGLGHTVATVTGHRVQRDGVQP